jgi:hypothetical protein
MFLVFMLAISLISIGIGYGGVFTGVLTVLFNSGVVFLYVTSEWRHRAVGQGR